MQSRFFISFLIVFIISHNAFAKVQIAFFEKRTKDGQLIAIEPHGHFYHVVIQFQDHWLEAHPFYGVREVRDLHQMGELYSLIEIEADVDPKKYQIEFGKSFSVTDSWENKNTTYCSKLVAEILDIQPVQMKSRFGLGLSPDGLYAALKALPHKEIRACSKLF